MLVKSFSNTVRPDFSSLTIRPTPARALRTSEDRKHTIGQQREVQATTIGQMVRYGYHVLAKSNWWSSINAALCLAELLPGYQ